MNTTNKILIAGTLAGALFLAGRYSIPTEPDVSGEPETGAQTVNSVEPEEARLWTCPMHAQIKLPDAGDCPICGMDLVELTKGHGAGERQLVMSPASKALSQINVQSVGRKNVTRMVRMTGKVAYDETSVRTISAWVPGRLDRLFVDYTGVSVREGDHLVSLYSPELLTAQEELLTSKQRLLATAGETSEFLAASNRSAYQSARDKLTLWGLTEAQVEAIEARGTAEDHVELTSPTAGVVLDKYVDEGDYVQTGTHIYRVANLSQLWVQLDAYEQDLAWLRLGQDIQIEVAALPAAVFEGRISYIDPLVQEHTRTAKVRVILDNSNGLLKPGMFVRAAASSRLGAAGAVLDPHLAGKWVGPMHPESIKDEPGLCDICGMELVPAEDLGLVATHLTPEQRPLVVPVSAVLLTGKRAVVYVQVPGADKPTFEGRVVRLGPRAGDEYLVLEGLDEGEVVVTNGAFRIDSAMQIQAKPSMMSMEPEAASLEGPAASLFRESISPLYRAYLGIQVALAADDEVAARGVIDDLDEALMAPVAEALPSEARATWAEEKRAMATAIEGARSSIGIEGLRAAFEPLSNAAIRMAEMFGQDGDSMLHEAYCPMALDGEGASWLQVGDDLRNPYFGDSMLKCGEIRQTFHPAAHTADQVHAHEDK